MPKAYKNGVLVTVTDQDVSDTHYISSSDKVNEVRAERDQLIAATDWWATSDRTMTAEQTAYRQALRDVPTQSGFPDNVTWPQEPSS